MSILTGIAPSAWADEGERAMATAFDILIKRAEEAKKNTR